MKKMLVALLALLMALSFGACFNAENSGGGSSSSEAISGESTQESSEEETSEAESVEEESADAGNSTSDWVDIEFPRPQ